MAKDLVNVRVLLFVLVCVSVIVFFFVIVPRDGSGTPVVRTLTNTGEESKDKGRLLEGVKLTLDSYRDLIQVLSASFAIVPFLVGYQSKNRLEVSGDAWLRLSVGVLLLGTALLLALLGRERILTMLARDAVDLAANNLLALRWMSYTCLTLAAVLVSSYAVSAANSPHVALPSGTLEKEDH